ncbi:MAG TPA: L-fucose:H+ symporter permease [Steroidobacteraceae bacterium]|jgi:FHS family L-fucose permease-like MFS transporter|nr:L-fucose:H+ symporter permease [Steroidobacteraceae bacterium]
MKDAAPGTSGKPPFITPGYLGATVLVVALFAFWGMSNSLNDVLIPQFRKTFLLGDFASSFVQFATFIGYFAFAIPASLFMRRFGYRAAVVMGLVLFGTGALLFYPAAQFGEYHFFLGALFVVASGLSFLETSANPMIAAMGPPESADQRLNFAQTFNPLGTIVGVFLGKELILSENHLAAEQIRAMEPAAQAAWRAGELAAVKLPYLGIACVVLLWALLVAVAKFPPLAQRVATDADAEAGGFRGLLAFRRYWLGVAAQFAYVGAQVGVWSFVIRYTQFNTPGTAEKVAANNLLITLTLFFAGRFIGTLLMSKFRPALLLTSFAAADVVLCAVAALAGGGIGLYALMLTSFFMSIQFPTIFTMSLRGLGAHTKSGSSFLVMAIVGGAVIPPIMGLVSDSSSINMAMLVPAICFAVVCMFAWVSRREEAPRAALAKAA